MKKRQLSAVSDYPRQKPIIWLKVLKESSSKINNIDYHPLFFFPVVDGGGSSVTPAPLPAICFGKCQGWVNTPESSVQTRLPAILKWACLLSSPNLFYTSKSAFRAGLAILNWSKTRLLTVSLSQSPSS